MFLIEISRMLRFFDEYFDFGILGFFLDCQSFFSCPVMQLVPISREEDFCVCTTRDSIIRISSVYF